MTLTEGKHWLTFSFANVGSQMVKAASKRFCHWDRVGILVLVLSVFFQSYVAQTHIHRAGSPFAQLVGEIGSVQADAPQGPLTPRDGDSANCLLCQAMVQAGALTLPVLMTALLPLMLCIGLVQSSARTVAPVILAAQGWRSRAPPLS